MVLFRKHSGVAAVRRAPLFFALLLMGGCNNTQLSSGAEYLAARPEYSPASGTDLDKAVVRAANVEPLLRFPARFGLARISHGQFVPVPPREADAWIAFAQSHGQYGEFVPVSPLIGDLVTAGAERPRFGTDPIVPIRLAAARQHIDAVLVYAVGGYNKDKASPLSILDLTIIGAYLVPSRSVEGTAVASALLFDVRNGYPYGTVSATSTQTGFVPAVGSGNESQNLQVDAQVDAVTKLTGEVDKMLITLHDKIEQSGKTPRPHPTLPTAETVVPGKSKPVGEGHS
jgi:hypothetical protein